MRTVGRPREYRSEYLEILVEGDFLLCFCIGVCVFFYWEVNPSSSTSTVFLNTFFVTWFKSNELLSIFLDLVQTKNWPYSMPLFVAKMRLLMSLLRSV